MRRHWSRVGWLLSVSLAVWLACSEGAAAAGWSITRTRGVSVPSGELLGLTCPARAFCIGVGDHTTMSGVDVPLVEDWNGAHWAPVSIPRPPGATAGFLSAVSCSSRRACMAVGSYDRRDGTVQTLAERWDGGTWSIVATPNLAGFSQTRLNSVSCVSGGICVAVGHGSGRTKPFTPIAARWNGSSWSLLPVPRIAGEGSYLNGVSCVSATWCEADGTLEDAKNGLKSLVEQWNGASWSVQKAPSTGHGLTAVVCTSMSACTAIGDTIIRWDGGRWKLQRSLTQFSFLSGLSCASANACVAVGEAPDTPERDGPPEAMVWNGQTWALKTMRTPAHARYSLPEAVACVSRSSCLAVGRSQYLGGPFAPVAYRLHAANWSLQPVRRPLGPLPSQLSAVACASTENCLAVGDYVTVAGMKKPLAERWDGTRWAFVHASAPAGTSSSELLGVACVVAPTTSSGTPKCFSVGAFTNKNGTYPLIEDLTGGRLSIQASPMVSARGQLSAVSCSASNACMAVGTAAGSRGGLLAERWDGSRWTVQQPTNRPDTGGGFLSGVSCPSMGGCTAVGTYQLTAGLEPPEVTLAERSSDGWTMQDTPAGPAGQGDDNQLTAVSCSSATDCTAVGRGGSAQLGQWSVPVVEDWNGNTWTADPAHGQGLFASVSCASSEACVAVGGTSADYGRTFAELWNGSSWALQATPNPPIGLDGSATLNGVSCPSASLCTAVGAWSTDTGTPLGLPLIETYNG